MIYITLEEKKQIREEAEKNSLSFSSYVRFTIMKNIRNQTNKILEKNSQ